MAKSALRFGHGCVIFQKGMAAHVNTKWKSNLMERQ